MNRAYSLSIATSSAAAIKAATNCARYLREIFGESSAGTIARTRERRRMRIVLKSGMQARFAWSPEKSPTHSL
jgi:hypothetical protein